MDDIGELGEWVELVAQAPLGDVSDGFGEMVGQVLGGIDSNAMSGLFQQAQQMMSDPAMASQMMEIASQMMTGAQAGGSFDMGAIAAQAKQLAEDDPALVERLKQQLGATDEGATDEGPTDEEG